MTSNTPVNITIGIPVSLYSRFGGQMGKYNIEQSKTPREDDGSKRLLSNIIKPANEYVRGNQSSLDFMCNR